MKPVSISIRRPLLNSHEPSESPNNVALAGTYPSRFSINDIVSFQPKIREIDDPTDTAFGGTRARVSAISFDESKVLYELQVDDGEGGWYTSYPIRNVDSYFVRPWKL